MNDTGLYDDFVRKTEVQVIFLVGWETNTVSAEGKYCRRLTEENKEDIVPLQD